MLTEPVDFTNPNTAAKVAILGAAFAWAIFALCIDYSIKVAVPVVGVGVRYTKWLAALRNVWYARESISEGYAKYGDYAFQIPTMTRMEIFICDRKMTKEYYDMDEDHLSFRAVMSEEFQFNWLLPGQCHDVQRIPNSVIAKALSWQRTRASKPEDPFFRAFSVEFTHGFQEEMNRFAAASRPSILSTIFGASSNRRSGWHAVQCFPFALRVIARLTTYSLFGNTLCRNTEFLDMCCRFGDAIPRDALILRACPGFIRPYLSKLLPAPILVKRLQDILVVEIHRRRARGINPMKDLLDFAMNWVHEHPQKYNDWHVTDMMTNTIFAALHTSSQLVVHCMFELATRPEYSGPLREEVERCFKEHGDCTKKAIDSMYKMDSFIKETQRANPLDASALARMALKEYTFSNGLQIPKGSVIFTPNSPLFADERFYPNPEKFDGFRFEKMRNDPELKSSCDLTSTDQYSMHFGIGRHACPGRFMVSDEVKLALIHLLQNFDFCMEDHGRRPKNVAFGKFILPDMGAKVWLRETSRRNNLEEIKETVTA